MLIIKKYKKIIAVAIIVLIIGGYYWYSKSNSSSSQVRYVTAKAEKGMIVTSVSGSGNVIVDQSSNIDPTITGTVANLAVSAGDKVTKGQLLFTIDNDELSVGVTKARASLTSAESSLKTAQANKKQAQSDYNAAKKDDSGKSVLEEKALKDKLAASKISETAAQQSLASAQADYQNQASDAAKRRVTSPIDGTVNEINIKNGDDLSKLSSGSSRTVPIIIGDLATMKAQVEVSEVDIASVAIGQEVTLTFNAIDNFTAKGKVEKMDSLGTLTSGVVTYKVTIGFDSLDERIRPEMSVSASIITDSKQDVVIIPNGAVKSDSKGYYVEIMKSDGTIENKSIEIGLENNSKTEVISGITAGDAVVTQTVSGSSSPSSSPTPSTSSKSSNRRGPGMIPGM